jgi:biopolymer transport protein ExbD
MKESAQARSWNISGLRTRYAPRSRIGQGLLSICPWLNLVLLLFLFLLIDKRLVLQPGVVVAPPAGEFVEGTRGDFVVVVLSVRGTQSKAREDVVFFDDVRYRVTEPQQAEALKQAFADRVRKNGDAGLIIQSDRDVPYGTVMDIMGMALDVGAKHVNVATRPF